MEDHNIQRDEIVKQLIPEVITECAVHLDKKPGEPCSSDSTVKKIGEIVGVQGPPQQVIAEAKAKLGCNTEKCVLEKLDDKIGHNIVKAEIATHLKIRGPTDAGLLSNVNIDGVLQQWTRSFDDFFAYNFNMRNYASYSWRNGHVVDSPDTLATIQFTDLYFGNYPSDDGRGKKYRCAACVINTHPYQNSGEHWMALFVDARADDRWTVEFFNSSGNAPLPEYVNWLVKTKNFLEDIAEREHKKVKVEIVRVTGIRHQKSRSECGLYSLFYIWARLHKIPPEYFLHNKIPDKYMFEFRQHLFNDPKHVKLGRFDWDEYSKHVNIQWE